jgi:hypothetical protein
VSVLLLQLAFSRTNQSQISLSWANTGGSFGLEQIYNLSPSVQWTTVVSTPALINGFWSLAIQRPMAPPFTGGLQRRKIEDV